jgi:putative ABC transport system permease protein
MYVIKNAIKNLGRNKGRNILTATIIFAIILATAVSIIINTTTSAIIEDYKSRFGSKVNIEFDVSNPVPTDELDAVTVEQRKEFANSELLKSSSFRLRVYVVPKDLHSLDETETYGNTTVVGGQDQPQFREPTALLIGSSQEDISDDFAEERRKIIQGKMYENKNECLISEQYAKLNNLSIGDVITLESEYTDEPMPEELIVAGIYEDKTTTGNQMPYKSPLFNRSNEILADFDDVCGMGLAKNMVKMGFVDSEYILKEPSMIDEFEKEVRSKGLSKQYLVSTDESSYNKIVGPVLGLSKITNTFLVVVLALGSMILILLSVLSIRERKYEIGVLRAMGMKKRKVAFGLLTESIVVTMLCLVLGLGIGSAVSQPMANSMLQNQIEIAEQNENTNTNGGASTLDDIINPAKPLSEVSIQIDSAAVLKISIIALALAGISSLVGIMYITKYEPIKILSERN